MDLKAMLNDGAEEAAKSSPEQKKSREQQRVPVTPGIYTAVSPQQASPYSAPYAPASASPSRQQSQHQGLTPLQTPSQAPGPGQYPFSQHTPGESSHQQYRTHEPGSATVSFARPPPVPYHYPPPHPPQSVPSNVPQSMQSHSTSSLSPTPPLSYNSPHSMRQSPLSARSNAPNQPPGQYGHQYSQSGTPLGPHPHYPRPPNSQEPQTPSYHQHSYSGASNGIVSGSPAQQQYGIGPPSDSPNAYTRPPPHQRQPSGYFGRPERERSESVSPKTKVPPKPPSLASRTSSQEFHQRTTSYPQIQTPSQNHMIQSHPHPQVAHPAYGQSPNSASEVAQTTLTSYYGGAPNPNTMIQGPPVPQPQPQNTLSQAQPRPALIHHSSSKMGMNHLLTPATESAPQMKQEMSPAEFTPAPTSREMGPPLKRAAESDESVRPQKQRKTRKYMEPPVWARLSKHNPRFSRQQAPNGTPARVKQEQTNGEPLVADDRPPWLIEPPLDHDLIHARRFFQKWEKSIKWNTPYPDILRALQDWLFMELDQLGDVGTDPREGTIEIEAKFGEIKRDGDRYSLPIMNAAVIHPHAYNKFDLHFESTMSVADHAQMNQYLNKSIQDSREPGRSGMSYQHPNETDSFFNLSEYGQQLLPVTLQRRQRGRKPGLRITRDNKAPGRPVIARIVKIPISNLHIFNPGQNYDCRISINLEVNLDRPDIDADALIAEDQKEREVDRIKDRMAYKHLKTYSIDLTKVDAKGLNTYELELEVDSNVLRHQMALLKNGQPNAFGDVVSGFLDNATFLMRQRQAPKPAEQMQQ